MPDPDHQPIPLIAEEPDGCRTFALLHISEGDLDIILRALKRTRTLSPSLLTAMREQGIIGHAGRHPGSTAVTQEEYEAKADELRPTVRRESDLIKAMAYALALSEETIRDYANKRGWKL